MWRCWSSNQTPNRKTVHVVMKTASVIMKYPRSLVSWTAVLISYSVFCFKQVKWNCAVVFSSLYSGNVIFTPYQFSSCLVLLSICDLHPFRNGIVLLLSIFYADLQNRDPLKLDCKLPLMVSALLKILPSRKFHQEAIIFHQPVPHFLRDAALLK